MCSTAAYSLFLIWSLKYDSPPIFCFAAAAPADFDKYVNGGKHALVEFYAPWLVEAQPAAPCLMLRLLRRNDKPPPNVVDYIALRPHHSQDKGSTTRVVCKWVER